MFERYTESARRVLFFARYEVSQLGGTRIDPDHILLALIRESQGLVGRILAQSRISLEAVRQDLERGLTLQEKIATSVEVPFGADTQAVLRLAAEEADHLLHKHIGTEHLLLGLLRVEDSRAAAVLRNRGLRVEDVREKIVTLQRDQTQDGP